MATSGTSSAGAGTTAPMRPVSLATRSNNPFYFGDNIKNTLGLQAMSAKGTLKAFALSKPVEYTKMRNEVYTKVLEKMVSTNYEIIWNLLSDGKFETADAFTVDGVAWSPHLPDAQIGKMANAFAESTMEAFEKIMSEILPDDYKNLAEERQSQLNKLSALGGGKP